MTESHRFQYRTTRDSTEWQYLMCKICGVHKDQHPDDPPVAKITVPVAGLKSLRETLRREQYYAVHNSVYANTIAEIISQIDKHRPLGRDGKHGNRHTPTCGCDLD